MPFPFEVPFKQVEENIDTFVDEVFGALQSDFLVLPKGKGFIDYSAFEAGYESLKRTTANFRNLLPETIISAVYQTPISFVVLRTILGFTPPEWAYVTTQRTDLVVTQGAVRALDRRIRMAPLTPMDRSNGVTHNRIAALVKTACDLILEGAPEETPGLIHRLDKADTKHGLKTIHPLADLGVPYAMLLYERFLGQPFAGHRNSVSELVGDVLENAIESILTDAGISFRKTKRAERLAGFDQAPDFIIPSEFNPKIVIEAKVTEDDGTARDKVTRVQHLGTLSRKGRRANETPRFEVIACIAGRGFKQRREDMKKLLLATQGKVFTIRNLDRLVGSTQLVEYRTR